MLIFISQRVPGHIGATNVTVTGTHSDVEFQVSATVIVNEMDNEGERSEVTGDSTVFVPDPSKLNIYAWLLSPNPVCICSCNIIVAVVAVL